jgi:hypothetical protein
MTPYDVLSEAVSKNRNKSFRDLWCDFAIWESARGYSDDPSGPSKDALNWVRSLEELAVQIDDFEGDSKEDCKAALEAAFVAFSRLNHSDELCRAMRRWREWRLAEEAEKNDAKPMDSA